MVTPDETAGLACPRPRAAPCCRWNHVGAICSSSAGSRRTGRPSCLSSPSIPAKRCHTARSIAHSCRSTASAPLITSASSWSGHSRQAARGDTPPGSGCSTSMRHTERVVTSRRPSPGRCTPCTSISTAGTGPSPPPSPPALQTWPKYHGPCCSSRASSMRTSCGVDSCSVSCRPGTRSCGVSRMGRSGSGLSGPSMREMKQSASELA
mmetsp:Transcript_43394/g.111016  ORF Transcript_43394/g.111016 Transcript_43394/m.111016 type:complete len:208 (-) Transcript_43394:345-968(-)